MCLAVDNCCCCLGLDAGTKTISVLFTLSSVLTVIVFAPLALLDGALPPARFYFYCVLATLGVFEVIIGALFIHATFKRKPHYTWPWIVFAWCKGILLLLLVVSGTVALVVNGNLDVTAEVSPVISVYFIYAVFLLYLACVVNSRRKELVLQNYWAEKHVLQHAKTQYYYM